MRLIAALAAALLFVSAAAAQPAEAIAELRVHGNHTTPDEAILTLSGLAAGQPATPDHLEQAAARLRGSGRFADVEVRRRYASIDNPSAILVVILVDEHAAVSDANLVPGPWARLRSAGMWLPIVSREDGYGFTYGGRVSFIDALGPASRVSIPLTWGGERRAAVEMERATRGPFHRVHGAIALSRRVNPHFEVPDVRREARVEAERRLVGSWLRAGPHARVTSITFGDEEPLRVVGAGARLTLDTRLDPTFPRDAVHASVGWERLGFATRAAGRWTTDLRGYLGLLGSSVLAVRGTLTRASGDIDDLQPGETLVPPAEQTLLGGSDSLRGYQAGYRTGSNAATASAELRVPINSPLSVGRLGAFAFVDAGTTWERGARLREQRFDRGSGFGLYFGAPGVMVEVSVAWPETGRPRWHAGLRTQLGR